MNQELHHALPAGYRLDEYEVESVLGHGGFGVTYLARDVNLGSRVAVKEYLPNDIAVRTDGATIRPKSEADRDEFDWGRERFLGEAQTLARFRHPNIVPVVRFFETNGTAYLVMEYQEGDSLSDILRRKGRLNEAELMQILSPLLDGLAEVHDAGFLHRDIKPGNIYIRADGSPVLLDFGAARQAVTQKSKSLTAIVTAGYAPQEQYFSSGNQGPWTDIYALGGVLYRAVAGATPVEAPQRASALMANEPDPLTPVAQAARGKYSDAVLAAIDWALRVLEKERPQSVEEWRGAFDGVPVKTPVTGPMVRSPGKSSGGRIAASIAVAALVLGAGFVGWQEFGDEIVPESFRVTVAGSLGAKPENPAQETTPGKGPEESADDPNSKRDTRKAAAEIRQANQEIRRSDAAITATDTDIARADAEIQKNEDESRRAEALSKRKSEEAALALEKARRVEDAARKKNAEEDAKRQAAVDARLKELERRTLEAEKKALEAAARPPAAVGGTQVAKADPSTPTGMQALFSGSTLYKGGTRLPGTDVRTNTTTMVIEMAPNGHLRGKYSADDFYGNIIENRTDAGRWKIESGKLCVTFDKWQEGQTSCYKISGTGPNYAASGAKGLLAGKFRLER